MTRGGRGVLAMVLAAQALRGLGYGLAAVQLGAVLRGQGLGAPGVSLVLAAVVAGSAAASLALGRWGDRVGRARSYGLLYGALALAGLVLAAGGPAWLLALVALSGALSTEVVESGPFTTLEQVMLASTNTRQPQLVRGFGIYNATATLAGAAGALPANRRLVGATLAGVGVAGALLATRLPSNLLLAAIPLAPSLPVAVGLLARTCLSQMDVPTRQTYVMALVPPAEQTTAAAVTNTARYVTRPVGPALAGLLQPLGLALPSLAAGVLKSAYDLALWRLFRPVQLPTNTAAIPGGTA